MGITASRLKEFRDWFHNYCNSFTELNQQQILKFRLKEKHSYEVVNCIAEIADALNLTTDDKRIAETIGLLHDLGRFEQIKQFNTFSDAASMDHGDFGVEVIKDFNLLDSVDPPTREIIFQSVKYHNKFQLPNLEPDIDEKTLLFIKLIRDADKIDIFRVIMEVFTDHADEEANSIIVDLNLDDKISDNVFEHFMNNQIIHKRDVFYLNDYRVLILSWIHDINFPRTVEIFTERNYFTIIADTLPEGEYKDQIRNKLEREISAIITGNTH